MILPTIIRIVPVESSFIPASGSRPYFLLELSKLVIGTSDFMWTPAIVPLGEIAIEAKDLILLRELIAD